MLKALVTNWHKQPLLFALGVLALLQIAVRFPACFEPYWYGDEGIYLTLGQALNRGAVLYKDIIDHKTPVIYYLARVDTQHNFRILLLISMTAASVAFFWVVRKITARPLVSLIGAGIFSVITALPWYEGLIPNGELFVMSFILIGLAIAINHHDFYAVMVGKEPRAHFKRVWLLVLAGVFLSIGVLTKVPAVFDVAAIFFIGFLALANQVLPWSKREDYWRKSFVTVFKTWGWLLLGVVAPILFSILYFALKGALREYFDYGLMYNFRYSGSWSPEHIPAQWQFLTSFWFKAGITGCLLLGTSLLGSKFSLALRWSLGWVALATFASLLSNRPYPHYFLQILPPLVILLTLTGASIRDWQKNRTKTKQKQMIWSIIFGLIGLALFIGAQLLVGMKPYSLTEYYGRFFKYSTKQISAAEYRNSFNGLMKDNYAIAPTLMKDSSSTLFIWGTNPMLYALTHTIPESRFTVQFHIKDFNAEQETLDRLNAKKPTYIILMHDETPPIELTALLNTSYLRVSKQDTFSTYKHR